MGEIAEALRQAWTNFLNGLADFVPRVLAMLVIILVGWLIAFLLRTATRVVLGWLRINSLFGRFGGLEFLKKAHLAAPDVLAGTLVFWVVWIGFILSGMQALGFAGTQSLIDGFVQFVPHLVVAMLIVVVGFVTANFAWRATLLAAVNAKLRSARILAGALRYLIVLLSVAMALEQIGVADRMVLTAFAIAFGAVMLGLAIAFGVGGGPVARKLLEQYLADRDKSAGDGSPHL